MSFSTGVTIVRFTKLIERRPLMLDVLLAEGPLDSVWQTRQRVSWSQGEVTWCRAKG
jgi:hypothetical protein